MNLFRRFSLSSKLTIYRYIVYKTANIFIFHFIMRFLFDLNLYQRTDRSPIGPNIAAVRTIYNALALFSYR